MTAETWLRGRPYNTHLPYLSRQELLAEQEEASNAICQGLADAIAARMYTPALRVWCFRIEQFIDIYKYSWSKECHKRIVMLLWTVFIDEDLDISLQQRIAKTLHALLWRKRIAVIPFDELELPWKPLYKRLQKYHFTGLRCPPPVPRDYVKSIVTVVRAARNYFPACAVSDIWRECRPMLCMTDQAVFDAAACLATFLPTDRRSPAASAHPASTYISDILSLWAQGDDSRDWNHMWLAFCCRSCDDPDFCKALEPHLDWMFAKLLDTCALPIGPHRSMPAVQPGPNPSLAPFNVSYPGTSLSGMLMGGLLGPVPAVKNHISRLFEAAASFFHPSNVGRWSELLANLMLSFVSEVASRHQEQLSPSSTRPDDARLSEQDLKWVADLMQPYVFMALYSKSPGMVTAASLSLRHLATFSPSTVLPQVLDKVYPALETLTATHQTVASIAALTAVCRTLFHPKVYAAGTQHMGNLLLLTLPGIDANDPIKTNTTLYFYRVFLANVPVVDCSASSAGQTDQPSEAEAAGYAATALFADWVSQFLERVMDLLQVQVAPGQRRYNIEQTLSSMIRTVVGSLFGQLSPPLYDMALNTLFRRVTTSIVLDSAKTWGSMVGSAVRASPDKALAKFMPFLSSEIQALAEGHDLADDVDADETQVDQKLLWLMHVASRAVQGCGHHLLRYRTEITDILRATFDLANPQIVKLSGKMLRHTLKALSGCYLRELSSLNSEERSLFTSDPRQVFDKRCSSYSFGEDVTLEYPQGRQPEYSYDTLIEPEWHVPTEEEASFVDDILTMLFDPALDHLEELTTLVREDKESARAMSRVRRRHILKNLFIIRNVARAGHGVLVDLELDQLPRTGSYAELNLDRFMFKCSTSAGDQSKSMQRRARLYQLLATLSDCLVSNLEEDTKLIKLVIKVIQASMCRRVYTPSKVSKATNSYKSEHNMTMETTWGKKNLPRSLLLQRLALQHARRCVASRLATTDHELHRLLVSKLFRLATSNYAVVRARAQSTLESALIIFPLAKQDIYPRALALLDAAEDSNEASKNKDSSQNVGSDVAAHHARKGALYTLQSKTFVNFYCRRFDRLRALLQTSPRLAADDNQSVQTLTNKLFDTIRRSLSMPSLTHRVPETAVELAIEYGAASERTSLEGRERAIREELKAESKRVEAFKELLDTCYHLLHDKDLHWRYQIALSYFVSFMSNADVSQLEPKLLTLLVQRMVDPHMVLRGQAFEACTRLLALSKIPGRRVTVAVTDNTITPIQSVSTDKSTKMDCGSDDDEPRRGGSEPLIVGWRADNQCSLFHVDVDRRPATSSFEQLLFVDKNFAGWSCWPRQFQAYAPLADQPRPDHDRPFNRVIKALLLQADGSVPPSPSVSSRPSHASLSSDVDGATGVPMQVDSDDKASSSSELLQLLEFLSQERRDGSGGSFSPARADFFKGLARNFGVYALRRLRTFAQEMARDSANTSKQRCASEILGGFIRGAKYWNQAEREELWGFLVPLLPEVLDAAPNDSVHMWGAAARYAVYDRDVRRQYRLLDVLLLQDPFDTKLALTTQQICCRLAVASEALSELSWRGINIVHFWLPILRKHMGHPYKLIRGRVVVLLVSAFRAALPYETVDSTGSKSSNRTAEMQDAMQPLASFITELTGHLLAQIDTPPETGSEAFSLLLGEAKSFADFCQRILQRGVHTQVSCHIADVARVLLRLPELSEDMELQALCRSALRVLGEFIMPPWIDSLLFDALVNMARSASWHVKLRALGVLQVFLFRNSFRAPRTQVQALLNEALNDPQREVQLAAANTLSGLLRCGVLDVAPVVASCLEVSKTKLRRKKRQPSADSSTETEEDAKQRTTRKHSAVLGLYAALLSQPYDVPDWMPQVLMALADATADPEPIRATAQKALSEFWRTHRDTWQEDKHKFTDDQRLVLTDLLISPSYYV